MCGLIGFQNMFKHFRGAFTRTVYRNEQSRAPYIAILENALICREHLAPRAF